MRERQQRLRVVKKIIRSHRIESQEQLLHLLAQKGFSVTQATLSRDLKLLKVGKQARGTSGSYYTLPSEELRREQHRSYVEDFARGYISLNFSGSLAIIRTLNGHANSVAIALENLDIEPLLGTVAGDDTVFVALKNDTSEDDFIENLRERFPEFEE
ncbi:transcriptional regulator, ArgR family [Alkalispirochaeta americana]|uniref:Arginine repressor n=1 Tax=Alkalispirochaeta americana TaxID=159291 RepID=A0A1N6V9V0_9SPIO|nr:ArgR family transcriptional regulator [Alkalispirochaeta americana]SIQ74660.1 transcriptional regulator, ArgR family [Alkalispirochaeta americana]